MMYEDQIAHAGNRNAEEYRNAAEYRNACTSLLCNGYDASTRTVYEFHGCLWQVVQDVIPIA